MAELSHDQEKALRDLLEWYGSDRQAMPYVTLGGYAGTGKTTLIAVLRSQLHRLYPELSVGFGTYTGKAARVLHTKLTEAKAIYKGDSVGTIHSLIYSPILNDREEIVGWKLKDKVNEGLIIIDEASMVDGEIWSHLVSYRIPIVVVGDHGQLPPIRGSFNLMQKPDLVLSEIHRQAKGNPIIDVSIQARMTGKIEPGKYGPCVVKYSADDAEAGEMMGELLANYRQDTLILCGFNATRRKLNAHLRSVMGFESPDPQSGDRVICLRNNHKKQVYNGMLGTVMRIARADEKWYQAEILMDGEESVYSGLVLSSQFGAEESLNFTGQRKETISGDLFDFGYALTVHKAQGSQAKRVILFEQRFPKMDDDQWRRWLYTAVTRAERELYIFPQ